MNYSWNNWTFFIFHYAAAGTRLYCSWDCQWLRISVCKTKTSLSVCCGFCVTLSCGCQGVTLISYSFHVLQWTQLKNITLHTATVLNYNQLSGDCQTIHVWTYCCKNFWGLQSIFVRQDYMNMYHQNVLDAFCHTNTECPSLDKTTKIWRSWPIWQDAVWCLVQFQTNTCSITK